MREDQKFFERNVDNSSISWLLLWIFAVFGFGKNHDTSSAVSQYKQQASELGALDKEKDKWYIHEVEGYEATEEREYSNGSE